MKKSTFFATTFLVVICAIQAQSAYMMGGVGVNSKGGDWDDACMFCDDYPPNCPEGYSLLEVFRSYRSRTGHSFFFGLGKDVRVSEGWVLQGIAKAQFFENPNEANYSYYDRGPTRDLMGTSWASSKLQYASFQASLGLEHEFRLMGHACKAFGGGFVRFKIKEWEKTQQYNTYYYTGIVTQAVYDSTRDCQYNVIVDKTKLNQPIISPTLKTKESGNLYRELQYGVFGGVSFPIFSSREGQIDGQIAITQDFTPSFNNDLDRPNFRLTSITTGLVFTPNIVKTPAEPAPAVSLPDTPVVQPLPLDGGVMVESKRQKRIPINGIGLGISQQELFFTSLNFGYLSSKRIGFDASFRFLAGARKHQGELTAFIGPVFQMGKSRFFAKGGLEAIFGPDGRYSPLSNGVLFFVGGKYLLPVYKSFGLHLEVGSYLSFMSRFEIFPALGLGIISCPFGPKTH